MGLLCTVLMICLLSIVQGEGILGSRSDFKKPDDTVFNVMDTGAAGNGRKNDTQAFLDAWRQMCEATADSPTMVIPEGVTFLLYRISFEGPCKSANPHVQVSGKILAPTKRSWDGPIDYWIQFSQVNGLVITGSNLSVIDGQGSDWWEHEDCFLDNANDACDRPTALKMSGCDGVEIRGLRHVNSQRNHISLTDCRNVTVSGITIKAPKDSPNTDGIDISHSTNIRIEHSNIGTGDDCVAINGGCSDINITNVACGPGHGISIGSLGAKGATEEVERVRVQNCNFTDTLNGARIKTWQGGSGCAKDIWFEQIKLERVHHPIVIDQYYCNGGHHCTEYPSAVKISDVMFNGIRGSSTNIVVVSLNCSKTVACTNIIMNQIDIETIKSEATASSYCMNVIGEETDTSPHVSCLR
ncbi:probable polygalacturonase At3g15720 [Papaver somniferum]|uniref:probable polygalacturonase At3g15720 n=1 Tax=Papaver somniferum TaxID=3469 RepID=UPI000E6FB718|nr:probable polygalacturonase At3g15720 [Papaver somniferum]